MIARAAAAMALLLAGCTPAPRPAPEPMAVRPPPVAVVPVLILDGAAEQGALLPGSATGGTVTLDGRAVALGRDGRFVIGFDRDAPASALLAITAPDGTRQERRIAVASRAWVIERVNAPYRAGRTDAEFDELRPAELAAIVAARAMRTDAEGWRQPLRWPATGRLSGRFGSQRVYQGRPGSYHSGDDVAAAVGTPVVAPADGVVVLAADRPFTLEGNLLMIDHGLGLNSALLHLSRIDVAVGDRVTQGQVVGAVGRTGRVTGAHLHWSLQWQGAKLDPSLVAGPLR